MSTFVITEGGHQYNVSNDLLYNERKSIKSTKLKPTVESEKNFFDKNVSELILLYLPFKNELVKKLDILADNMPNALIGISINKKNENFQNILNSLKTDDSSVDEKLYSFLKETYSYICIYDYVNDDVKQKFLISIISSIYIKVSRS